MRTRTRLSTGLASPRLPLPVRLYPARLLLCALFVTGAAAPLSGCPHKPQTPVIAPASRTVERAEDIVGAEGIPATVIGTLERRTPDGISPGESGESAGTAIVLHDGTAIYVSEGAPPSGWEWMLGTPVRIQGVLWERAPSGWPVAKLEQAEPPMPADVSILLGPPQ